MRHPYEKYEDTALWRALDLAITDLERNGDLTLSTSRAHVIGYLCKQSATALIENHGHNGGST
jgi:hypothetical protein